jgi:hypothetical protein
VLDPVRVEELVSRLTDDERALALRGLELLAEAATRREAPLESADGGRHL